MITKPPLRAHSPSPGPLENALRDSAVTRHDPAAAEAEAEAMCDRPLARVPRYWEATRPNTHLRVLLLACIVAIATAVLAAKLWHVQIADGPEYAARLALRSDVRVRLPPVRGAIRDRHGVLLAGNRARFDVEFYLPEMVRAFRERHGGHVPEVRYQAQVHGMLKTLSEPDIVAIVNTAVVPRLRALGLPAEFDAQDLARHFRIAAEVPYPCVEGADHATIARFAEQDIGLPGVRIASTPIREYPHGALAAHVLGYVGDPEEFSALADLREFDFYDPNVEGKAQVEALMDRVLRGTPGVRTMRRSVKGELDREVRVVPPTPGATVELTIDARIQFIAEQTLRAVGRAAAVVLDPRNGDILAMASVPSFDPNEFVPAIAPESWASLTRDDADPLVNRAVCAYPPGSTFKLVPALAGLREGLAKKAFACRGGVQYGDHYFQCWKKGGHGRLTLSDAIKVSCNAFFYQYGNAAGIDAIGSVGAVLGLGQPPGTGLSGEQAGVLPGPAWLRENHPLERWTSAFTANVSIGQGYDLVSPLQLCMAYAAIANGGVTYYPRIIHRVVDPAGRTISQEPAHIRGDMRGGRISPADFEKVREGLWKVVNEDGGTARRARLAGGIVAGKTGTAQAQREGREDTIAWFVCFAPFDAPRYAVCVMVQGGAHGGSVAAPIAGRILEEAFAMERGLHTPTLARLAPARHRAPFRMIESLDLASSLPQVAAVSQQSGPRSRASSGNSARAKKSVRIARAQMVAPPSAAGPPRSGRNFFERLFNLRRNR